MIMRSSPTEGIFLLLENAFDSNIDNIGNLVLIAKKSCGSKEEIFIIPKKTNALLLLEMKESYQEM